MINLRNVYVLPKQLYEKDTPKRCVKKFGNLQENVYDCAIFSKVVDYSPALPVYTSKRSQMLPLSLLEILSIAIFQNTSVKLMDSSKFAPGFH